jgi:hypothetical protein
MVLYRCEKCMKEFNKKSNFLKHSINKKTSCVNENELGYIQNDELIENENITKNNCSLTAVKPKISHQINCKLTADTLQNKTDIVKSTSDTVNGIINALKSTTDSVKGTSDSVKGTTDTLKGTTDNNKLRCPCCNMYFTRKDNLTKHIKARCKNKKHIETLDLTKSNINVDIFEKYEKIQQDNVKLIEILEEYKYILKENNLIKNPELIVNNEINTNNTNNGSININNGPVNNGTVNNVTINNIVEFGKEDISKFNLIEMMNVYLKSTGGNIFPNMLKYMNLNLNFPENLNISMVDLARENVKVYDGTKFITKKFKNVKGDILSSLSSHITNMRDTYIKNPKIKKSDDVLNKIKINDISVKLITNDDITPLFMIKKTPKDKIIKNVNKKADDEANEADEVDEADEADEADDDEDDSTDDEYLDYEGEKKVSYYENKRSGLQEITINKLKEELYNNRGLVLKNQFSIVSQ